MLRPGDIDASECHVKLRIIGLTAGLLLTASTALVAISGPSSLAATTASAAATGKITVTIRAPKGVAANVNLTGPRKTLFAKPAAGTSKSVTRQLPAGRYRVRPEAAISKGVLYDGTNGKTVTVTAGRSVRITVTFAKVASASALHTTAISSTRVALAWSAPSRATFALRRTAGSRPAASRFAGTAVRVSGHTAADVGLRAGKQYTFALFTHLAGRWAGPITLQVGTVASNGSKTAAFAVNPGALLATPADVRSASATGSGVQVRLSPSAGTPVIGSAVVLPPSASLPGGYIGQVSSISSDGSTVTLQPASLSSAFAYYDISIPSFATAATALSPNARHASSSAGPAEADCGGSSDGTITFSPSLRLNGSFHATVNSEGYLRIPQGASLSMQLTATLTGAMSIEASSSLSCELTFGPFFKTITVDPVPISILFTPSAEFDVEGAVDESNLGASVTGGLQFSGTMGLRSGAHFTGSDILTAQPLTPDITASGSVTAKVGGEVVVGPGAGDKDTGAIAGISGEFDPLNATFEPASPQDPGACFKASAALFLQLALDAKAWVGSWSVDRKITFKALTGQPGYPGSPWYFPANCENSTPLSVTGGALPDGQVSTLYDHTLSASGGTQPYTWAVVDGSPPAGITLSSSGELSGTPVSDGTSQFTAQVTDSNGHTATGSFSLTVNPVQTAADAITEYDVSPDLGCAMSGSGDADGEFYGNTACGTIISVNGALYGPASIPAGGNLTGASNYGAWDPVSQTTAGSGTSGDPYVITTAASADGSPITASQTDTYAIGGSTVGTTTTLTNSSSSSVQVMLYHAFDCYPGDSDTGTGTSANGSVSCVSDNVTSNGAPTLRLTPGTGGSTFVEEIYADLWSDISTGNAFSDTVLAQDHDTSEGLAWSVTVPANGSVSVQYNTDLLLTLQ